MYHDLFLNCVFAKKIGNAKGVSQKFSIFISKNFPTYAKGGRNQALFSILEIVESMVQFVASEPPI